MIVKIADVLTAGQVAEVRRALEGAVWIDGRVTAGAQSALAKNNLQIPEDSPVAKALGGLILDALRTNPTFVSAALPLRVFPPLFNRYDQGMSFGGHIDNAIRFSGASRYRTDLSATLFLSDPDDYDGGALVIRDGDREAAVKLPAGHMVLYPATTLHQVEPVTRGARWASFFWVQSMVRGSEQRALLFQMDQAIQALSRRLGGEDSETIALTGAYHNLIRMWAEV
jgi:PKHD-type hydroxylase